MKVFSSEYNSDVSIAATQHQVSLDGQSFHLSIAASATAIEAMQMPWLQLEQNSNGFDYFQSFNWCHSWACAHADVQGLEPRVYMLTRNGRPVCVLPMMVETKNGFKNLRMLSEPLGQYSNILVNEAELSEKAGEDFLVHIQKHENVDSILFAQYPEGSFIDRVVANRGFKESVEMEASIATLGAFDTWEDVQGVLNTKTRKERRRRMNKLNTLGTVDYKVVMGGTEAYDKLMTEALEMKAVWLRETGRRSDQLLSKETEMFFKRLKGAESQEEGMPPQGAIAHVLSVDGQSVGIELGMMLDKHYYCYLGAFDYSWRKYSVGKIQMEMAQKWALDVGVDQFDFLGDPSDYKAHWTQAKHNLKSRYIPLTGKGFLYVVIWRAYFRPFLKSIYASMGTGWRKKLGFLIGFAERMRSGKTATVPKERRLK